MANIVDKFKRMDKFVFILFIFFIFFTLFFLTPWIHANDGAGYYSYVRSAFVDKDLNLQNEKEFFEQKFQVSAIQRDNFTGVYYSQYPIGTPLLWSPFYLMGHLFANSFGYDTDGYSFPYIYMINLGSAILGFLALLMIYNFCRKFFSKKVCFLSIITFWLSSSIFYYMYFEASLSHCASLFAVTSFIYYWYNTKNNRTYLQWFFLGLLSSLMLIVRYQNVFFMVLPLIFSLLYYLTVIRKKDWKKMLNLFFKNVLYLMVFLIGLIPQLLVLKYQHGYVFSAESHYHNSFTLIKASYNWINVLFSTNHGLFLWTPVIFISVFGLIYGIKINKNKETKKLIFAFLVAFSLQLLLISTITAWNGAQSYGHRMFINCSLIFVFGFAILINKLQKHINFSYLIVICMIFIGWNFNLMIQYGLRLIPAEGSINFLEVIKNTFFVIPNKLIGILKKFLFSRSSFVS